MRFAVDGVQVGGDQSIGQISPARPGGRPSCGTRTARTARTRSRVTADPANTIVEKDESNNAASRQAAVQGSKVALN